MTAMKETRNRSTQNWLRMATPVALAVTIVAGTMAQAAQSAAGAGKQMAFDVASIKANKSNDPPYMNFPLGPGDVYIPNGGFFKATNLPLATYIFFAYKIKGNQMQSLMPQLPGWVNSERFDIQARAEGSFSKDDMRSMMRSLLADRFKLALHYQTRQVPVLALVPAKPGKLGPQLRQHTDDAPCPTRGPTLEEQTSSPANSSSRTVAGGFPALCGGILALPPSAPGRLRAGARNVTIPFLADALSGIAGLGRPMLDETGLTGTFDFILEWTRELPGPHPPGAVLPPDSPGPTFEEAMREQLGLKLESRKGPVDVIVIDYVQRPTEN